MDASYIAIRPPGWPARSNWGLMSVILAGQIFSFFTSSSVPFLFPPSTCLAFELDKLLVGIHWVPSSSSFFYSLTSQLYLITSKIDSSAAGSQPSTVFHTSPQAEATFYCAKYGSVNKPTGYDTWLHRSGWKWLTLQWDGIFGQLFIETLVIRAIKDIQLISDSSIMGATYLPSCQVTLSWAKVHKKHFQLLTK